MVHNGTRHVGRNCETDSDIRTAGPRQDLRIDSDQFALRVDQSATRVTLIDRGVGLQKIFKAAAADLLSVRASLRADDSHRHRLAHAEGITYRQRDVTNSNFVRIARRQVRQPSSGDLQNCQVAELIGSNQLRIQGATVIHVDFDVLSAIDHVMIRENVSVRADDYARTQRAFQRFLRLLLRRAIAEQTAEEWIV